MNNSLLQKITNQIDEKLFKENPDLQLTLPKTADEEIDSHTITSKECENDDYYESDNENEKKNEKENSMEKNLGEIDADITIEDLARIDKKKERHVLHRAALEQKPDSINRLCKLAKQLFSNEDYDIKFINKPDAFGNTPIINCCVSGKNKCVDCIKQLHDFDANVNVFNKRTLWSPLTWCAYYGDIRSIELLLKYGAISYAPDHRGYFPLDYAGQRDSKIAVKILLKMLVKACKDYDLGNPTYVQKNFAEFEEYDRFLRSPHLRNTMLYWACAFSGPKDLELINEILKLYNVYPELPLHIAKYGNSFHACCQYDKPEALTRLFEEIKNKQTNMAGQLNLPNRGITSSPGGYDRHTSILAAQNRRKTIIANNNRRASIITNNHRHTSIITKNHRHTSIVTNNRRRTSISINLNRSGSMSALNNKRTCIFMNDDKILVLTKEELGHYKKSFISYLKFMNNWILNYETTILAQFDKNKKLLLWETQDNNGNSQLHIASKLALVECVRILLDANANIELMNNASWKCRELCQNNDIKKLYKSKINSVKKIDLISNPPIALLFNNKIKPQLTVTTTTSPKSTHDIMSAKLSPKDNLINSKTVINLESSQILEEEVHIPDIVLICRLSVDKKPNSLSRKRSKSALNICIDILKDFSIYLAPAIEENSYLLMIKLSETELQKEATDQQLRMKLLNSYRLEPFDMKEKDTFEPFRSRERQEITMNLINKLIDMDLIKNNCEYSRLFFTHTICGVENIKNIWLNKDKWFLPQPLPQFFEYLFEGKHINFRSLDALKQYFGEKIAFYFASFSFYTCSLLFIAPFGMIASLFIATSGDFYSSILPYYVVTVMLWSTLVVEKWKRKSCEIALKWGTLDMTINESSDLRIRKEFWGDECINHNNGKLKNYSNPRRRKFVMLTSIPILLALLTGCVLIFYFSEQYKQAFDGSIHQFIGGAINGVGITILNIIYSKFARWLVETENHKYTAAYEKSLVFRIFAFRFLNSFVSIFYTAFFKQGGDTLNDLFYVLLPLLVVKQISSGITQVALPWLTYKFEKKKYFQTVLLKANYQNIAQQAANQIFDEKIQLEEDIMEKKLDENLAYRRPVLNFNTNKISKDTWSLSHVELNSLRVPYEDDVEYYADFMVQFSFLTIFAAAFPLGPFIALICNIVESRLKVFSLLYIFERPTADKTGSIGSWLDVWELLSMVSIGTNAVLLYQFNLNRKDFIFEIPDPATRVWVFVIAEHLMLVIKFFFSQIIRDKPSWVSREEKKAIEQEEDETVLPGVKQDDDIKAKKARRAQKKKLNAFQDFEESIRFLDIEIKRKTEEIEVLNKKINDVIQKQGNIASIFKNVEINDSMKSIFYMTYLRLEKELLLERLRDIAIITGQNHIIKCFVCSTKTADIECLTCEEKACEGCFESSHAKFNHLNQKHEIIRLDSINDQEKIDDPKSVLKEINGIIKDENIRVNKIWEKFEYYCFPTFKQSDSYHQLEKIFKIVSHLYITNNGIKHNKVESLKKYLKILDTKTDKSKIEFLDPSMSNKHSNVNRNLSNQNNYGGIETNLLKPEKDFINNTNFNIEEKLFMNRIAFVLYKKKGSEVKFSDFYKILHALQEGLLEAKLFILFDLIDEDDDGYICKEDIIKFLKASFMQNIYFKNEIELTVEKLFDDQKKIIDKKTAFKGFLSIKELRDMFSVFLQVVHNIK